MAGLTNTVRATARGILRVLPSPLADAIRGLKRKALNMRSREAVFSEIAAQNSWDGTESVSGPGSTMETTSLLREALPGLLAKYDVRSMLDIPCGDAYWISKCLPEGIRYTGADIVKSLIERNRAQKSDLGQFEVLDLVSADLPKHDLVMVRDCLIHLPNDMARQAIANVKRSGARYLLSTTYPGRADNIDIEIGGFRPVDLQAAPFNLPEPLELILETEGRTSNKSIALWDVSQL